MKLTIFICGLIFTSMVYSKPTVKSEESSNYAGYAIIGNGNVCAVYTDDFRYESIGITKLFYKNYTASYVQSSFINPKNAKRKILYEDFFSAVSEFIVIKEKYKTVTFITSDGVVVNRIYSSVPNDEIEFTVVINDTIITDKVVKLIFSPSFDSTQNFIHCIWNNGTKLLFASRKEASAYTIDGENLSIKVKQDKTGYVEFYLVIDENINNAKRLLTNARSAKDNLANAKAYWNKWLNSGFVLKSKDKNLEDFYARNLYSAFSSNLNGMIPADMTGQFLTNGMPQLYPRDALMTARAFVNSNHIESAIKVLDFWAKETMPLKTNGELYARYDANGLAVDAGNGARFDLPEWDSNSYFTILVYDIWKKTNKIKKQHYNAVKKFLQFVVSKIDTMGLLYEGGIIEWVGYLPATNMISISGLRKGAELCRHFGDVALAKELEIGARFIEANLFKMFDQERKTYIDLRPLEKLEAQNLWDTSVNFGAVWDYKINQHLRLTNEFIWNNCRKLGYGIQYFDSPDEGLAGYGHALFGFTTSAAAQYYAKIKDKERYLALINWMMNNSNVYRLMPERVYLDGKDCSPASPLSWCCAEFVNALISGYKAGYLR
ncbi:MAG: hypothetical protein N3A61_09275 [Ignavibacteria bacterium]|nr:hypothetical protein [Ignavibacteria bacterium]